MTSDLGEELKATRLRISNHIGSSVGPAAFSSSLDVAWVNEMVVLMSHLQDLV